MASYTQSNTDPVSVNGMFLKFYLDVMLGMTSTFENQNAPAFNLYAYYLRACIPNQARRDAVDAESLRVQEKIERGEFGEISKKQADFIRGFCIVTESVSFLDDALRITMHDASAMMDSSDEQVLMQLERLKMYDVTKRAIRDKRKRDVIDKKIFDGEFAGMSELIREMQLPDEEIPQDGALAQGSDTIDEGVDE